MHNELSGSSSVWQQYLLHGQLCIKLPSVADSQYNDSSDWFLSVPQTINYIHLSSGWPLFGQLEQHGVHRLRSHWRKSRKLPVA